MKMTERPAWRFYGREKIKLKLARMLEFQPDPHGRRGGRRQFTAIRLHGRRGTGKTRLLTTLQGEASSGLPFIIQELPDPDSTGKRVGDITGDLLEKAEMTGLRGISNHVRSRSSCPNDYWWFREEVMPALLKLGAVIVFDEFHHARELGMVSDVKQVIDRCRYNRLFHPGKIVLMGSHQQKFDALWESTAPLFQRNDDYIRLHQWKLSTVMEMAAEQGILASPGRFLTLWTAYGGMPRNWERYFTSESHSELHSIDDDNQWERKLLECERQVLGDESEHFDARAWVELPERQRELILWLGHNEPRGVPFRKLPVKFRSHQFRLETEKLSSSRLRLLMVNSPLVTLPDKSHDKILIADQATIFQTNVFREIVSPGKGRSSRNSPTTNIGLAVLRMNELEGRTLERMASSFLKETEDVTWTDFGISQPGIEGDMDVMAAKMSVGEDGLLSVPKQVWIGSSKRDAGRHKTRQTREFMDRFFTKLGSHRKARQWQEAGQKRLLFSVSFNQAERNEARSDGFEAVGIHDMARTYGIDPKPVHHSVPEHDREESPQPEPGYSPMKP